MNNYEEMRIESDVFATARENFDLLMQRLFKSTDHIRENEIRKEHASQPKFRKLPERWW